MPLLPLLFSGLALTVSVIVAWLTFFRRSIVKMTQPTIVAFEYTPPPHVLPSVSLSTLLFAKPKTWPWTRVVGGRVIESMFVKLSLNETLQSFPVWYHGNERSGLFVGETGVAQKHRFFTSKCGRDFRFTAGIYKLEVLACLVGDDSPKPLFKPLTVKISQETAQEVSTKLLQETSISVPQGVRLGFSWEPESEEYLPPVLEQEPLPFPGAPDYGPPAATLPNGNSNPNWMLYRNQRETRLHQEG